MNFEQGTLKNKSDLRSPTSDICPLASRVEAERRRVSVIMPVYNAEKYLREAIDSVLNQSFTDFELIAVDDGSTDSSLEILREYEQSDKRVRVVTQGNTGVAGARNRALSEVCAALVASLDADDIAENNWLKLLFEFMNKNPDCVVAGCRIVSMDEDGALISNEMQALSEDEIEEVLLRGRGGIVNSGCIMRIDAVRKAGGYDPDLPVGEDVDLFLKLGEMGRLANLPDRLLRVRRNFDSTCWVNVDEHVKCGEKIVRAAYIRRGLPLEEIHISRPPAVTPYDEMVRWSMLACYDGFMGTAWKYVWKVVKAKPMMVKSWKAMGRVVAYAVGLKKSTDFTD